MAPPNTHYAVVGARLGFRLNYLTPALRLDREYFTSIRLNDQPIRVRYNSVQIHDVINDTPNTCSLTIDAATPPAIGQRLTVRHNSNAPRLLFAGVLQTIDLTYEGRPDHVVYPCQAIDDSPAANRRLPWGQWIDTSATTVAQWLIATFAPGFSAAAVQPSLAPVSVNFDSTEGLDGCLRQLAKLIGGYFYWEDRVLHLFTDELTDTPDPIDAAHRFLHDPPITTSTDTSQVRTRVYGKGYAESIVADVGATDPIVPISNAIMFNPAGGAAVTETQRLTYTGTVPGGGGTLVGPGLTPSAAPVLALIAGAGLPDGTYRYAYAFVTAAGETLPSPIGTIATGFMTPPLTAPAATASAGAGVDDGTYDYVVTFVTALGETTPGPASPGALADSSAFPVTPPTPAPTVTEEDGTQGWGGPGTTIKVWVTFVTAAGETTVGPMGSVLCTRAHGFQRIRAAAIPIGPPGTVGRTLYFGGSGGGWNPSEVRRQPIGDNTTVNTLLSNVAPIYSTAGQIGPTSNTAGTWASPRHIVSVTGISTGAAGVVTARKLYRRRNFTGAFRLVLTLNDNTTTTATDTLAEAGAGAAAPTVNAVPANRIQVSGVAIGPSGTTARRVYRSAVNAAPLKLLTTIADNTTTALAAPDTAADATLGAAAPTGDTSGLKQPDGVVLAGAATLIVAGAGWASAGGGWAIIGNGQQTIRYTGLVGNALGGIPPTGPGAILATIAYNSSITAAPALLGVAGLVRPVIRGAPINLWVQRDDVPAQTAIAAIDQSDGVIEHLITDERRGETSLARLCAADLEQYSRPIQTVQYATRDPKTKSGKPITITLASPAIAATLTIQDVTITEINVAARLNPRFTVSASSVRFSLDAILRRLGAALDVTS